MCKRARRNRSSAFTPKWHWTPSSRQADCRGHAERRRGPQPGGRMAPSNSGPCGRCARCQCDPSRACGRAEELSVPCLSSPRRVLWTSSAAPLTTTGLSRSPRRVWRWTRSLDELHPELPFAGCPMLRDLLRLAGTDPGCRHVRTLMRSMGLPALYRNPTPVASTQPTRCALIRCTS